MYLINVTTIVDKEQVLWNENKNISTGIFAFVENLKKFALLCGSEKYVYKQFSCSKGPLLVMGMHSAILHLCMQISIR